MIAEIIVYGRRLNGSEYAKIELSGVGIHATVEGIGPTRDLAVEDLWLRLGQLETMVSDAAKQLNIDGDNHPCLT